MAQQKSIVQGETLSYFQAGDKLVLPVGGSEWYHWLEGAKAFIFACAEGHFTVYKDRSGQQATERYWRMYRRSNKRLHRVYLGVTSALTLEHLHNAAIEIVLLEKASAGQSVPGEILSLPAYSLLIGSQPVSTNSVPLVYNRLLERKQALAVVSALLKKPGTRLLTLTGPGGVGKTTFSWQVARHISADFADEVIYIGLETVNDPAHLPLTLAHHLGLQYDEGAILEERLISALKDKQLLLVLDNFEQILAAAHTLVRLLDECAQVKILVTSRKPLRVRGERTYQVQPLKVPALDEPLDSVKTVKNYGAVALFVHRARQAVPDFRATTENIEAIVQICVGLGGLPLAIELAAARVKSFSPQEFLALRGNWLPLLTNEQQTAAERQRTLSRTIAWSYHLLSPEAQRLFCYLVPFKKGFTLSSLTLICNLYNKQEMAQILEELVTAYLVQIVDTAEPERRFTLLETILEYARECLQLRREEEEVFTAHAACFLQFALKNEPHLRDAQQHLSLHNLEIEHENMIAALQWFVSLKDGENAQLLSSTLDWFWYMRGYWSEGCYWLEQALSLPCTMQRVGHAKALGAFGHHARFQGDYQRAEQCLHESIRLFRQLEHSQGLLFSLTYLADIMMDQGRYTESLTFLTEGLTLARKMNESWFLSFTLVLSATLSLFRGDYNQAYHYLTEGLLLTRKVGNVQGVGWALMIYGLIMTAQGNPYSGQRYLEEALAIFKVLKERRGLAQTYLALARAAFLQQQYEKAAQLYTKVGHDVVTQKTQGVYKWVEAVCLRGLGEIAAVLQQWQKAALLWGAAENLGVPVFAFEDTTYHTLLIKAQSVLGQETYLAICKEGHLLRNEQAFAYGEQVIREQVLFPHVLSYTHIPPQTFTLQEQKILLCMAQGLTNKLIAQELSIAIRTVEHHVHSIYEKLGISSSTREISKRAVATRYVIEYNYFQSETTKVDVFRVDVKVHEGTS